MPELHFSSFFLCMLKSSAFVVSAPVVGDVRISALVKLILAVVFAISALPGAPLSEGLNVISSFEYAAAGCFLGISFRIPFLIFHMAVAAFAQSYGISQYINTSQDTASGIVGDLFKWAGGAFIISANGLWLVAEGMFLDVSLAIDFAINLFGWLSRVSFQIVAPFIFFGLMFNVVCGFLNRAMPQLMVMLIFSPLSVFLAILFIWLHFDTVIGQWVDAVLAMDWVM